MASEGKLPPRPWRVDVKVTAHGGHYYLRDANGAA